MSSHRFRHRQIETIKDDGMHPDGKNLYLQVSGNGKAKSWIFRYLSPTKGKERAMGLGSLDTIGLDEARERARQHRQEVLDGIDPIDARKERREEQRVNKGKDVTFRECAEDWMDHASKNWGAPARLIIGAGSRCMSTHTSTTATCGCKLDLAGKTGKAAPRLIHDILMAPATEPLWETKHPTAEEVRQIIEKTLKRAGALGYIENANAASIKEDMPLSLLLRSHEDVHTVESHAGLPFDELGKFMAELRLKRDEPKHSLGYARDHRLLSLAGYIIEFLTLTAVRVGQVIDAKWDDFYLEDKGREVWASQQHKTKKKAGVAYFVALSPQALAVLDQMRQMQTAYNIQSDYVFPGNSHKGTMARVSILRFLRNTMGVSEATIHGFRTTFAHWAEEHDYPEKDSEMALGHKIGDKTRNVYKRNAHRIETLRPMMQDYANYCGRTERLPDDRVIPLYLKRARNGTTGK